MFGYMCLAITIGLTYICMAAEYIMAKQVAHKHVHKDLCLKKKKRCGY